MKKLLAIGSVITLSLTMMSPEDAFAWNLLGAGFYAPTYSGNAPDPENGAIIYDVTNDLFKGYSPTTGWKTLSGAPAPIAPTVQIFTSTTPSTYNRPTPAPLYIRVRMVGGGGGGAGSGTGGQTNGSDGGDTTFTSVSHTLTAEGGLGGTQGGGGNLGGDGGTASFTGSGASGLARKGNQGTTGIYQGTGYLNVGPFAGGTTVFGGGVGGGAIDAEANSGAGGASGSISSYNAAYSGGGGGAGGYIDVIISNPSSSYSYSVGTSGANGSGGTNGTAGGDGGTGIIIVEEYYQ